MAIITTADFRAFLDLGTEEDEARLAFFVNGASGYLVDATGRDWQQVTRTNELHRGTGTEYLTLRHYPLVSLSALTDDGIVFDVANPKIVDFYKPSVGIIVRTDGRCWTRSLRRQISVSYVGGPSAVPSALTLAALDLAAFVYQTTGGRTSAGDSGVSVNFKEVAALCDLPTVKSVLDQYSDVARGFGG